MQEKFKSQGEGLWNVTLTAWHANVSMISWQLRLSVFPYTRLGLSTSDHGRRMFVEPHSSFSAKFLDTDRFWGRGHCLQLYTQQGAHQALPVDTFPNLWSHRWSWHECRKRSCMKVGVRVTRRGGSKVRKRESERELEVLCTCVKLVDKEHIK